MEYEQRHPLPIPPTGPLEVVSGSMDTVFDWQYALERRDLLLLYEKGKAAGWNASDLDWSIDVDLEKMVRAGAGLGSAEVFNRILNPPRALDARESMEMNLNMAAWIVSQFLHGEQGALLATAKIVQAAPLEEAKWYAANQVADEARHVEVYHRYLTEKIGRSFEVNPQLQTLLDQIIQDSRWDMTYLGMQIMVEGLALAAFSFLRMQLPDEPLIQDITRRIMGDEARHVAFGVLSLQGLYADMTAVELAEREDFIIEASYLMRDRFLMEQVYERMDWNVAEWVEWGIHTPFMKGFRQMLFSKIVPNLRRLGLLTPRVRKEYDRMGLLHFEKLKDSTEETNPLPPAELLALLAQLRVEGPQGP